MFKFKQQGIDCVQYPNTTAEMTLSISANADGPRDAASRKIDHIALPTEYNYEETSVGQ